MVVEDKTHYVYLLLWAGRKLHTLTGGGCAFKASRLLQLIRYGDFYPVNRWDRVQLEALNRQ